MKLKPKQTYTIDLRGQLQFGQLPEHILFNVFRDGRAASPLITKLLLEYFSDDGLLEAKTDQKGFDFRHPVYPKIEMKCLTSKGLCFAQSGMTGVGRKVDREVLFDFVTDFDIHFLIPSIVNFPVINVAFVRGVDLFKTFPNKNCKVAASKALDFLNLPPAG